MVAIWGVMGMPLNCIWQGSHQTRVPQFQVVHQVARTLESLIGHHASLKHSASSQTWLHFMTYRQSWDYQDRMI